jgi:capsular exopolysaccharide synthesis family protein
MLSGLEPHLVTLLTPTAFEAEPYLMLGHLLEQGRKNSALSLVAISSPSAGEGKTITAINLAGVLARTAGARVLLVEADIRRPSVAAYLGLQPASGNSLVDAILDPTCSLKDVVRPCPPFNLAVLPAGRTVPSPHQILKAPRLHDLLQEARQGYDWVIIDTPPLTPFADCRLLETCIDGFLVVVTAHQTPRKRLEEALNVLDPTKLLGLVFNKDERLAPRYYSYYDTPSHNGQRKTRRTRKRRRVR